MKLWHLHNNPKYKSFPAYWFVDFLRLFSSSCFYILTQPGGRKRVKGKETRGRGIRGQLKSLSAETWQDQSCNPIVSGIIHFNMTHMIQMVTFQNPQAPNINIDLNASNGSKKKKKTTTLLYFHFTNSPKSICPELKDNIDGRCPQFCSSSPLTKAALLVLHCHPTAATSPF